MDFSLGGFLQGALGGGLGGASSGSPWGTLLGAGLGALGGGFGGSGGNEKLSGMYQDYYDQVGARGLQEAGPAAQAGYSGFRGNQRALVQRLEALSSGQGPSLAEAQLRSATDRAVGQQAGMAQSGRGNPAAAMFQAQNNAGQLQARAAQDAASARIAEQQMALQQLGLTLQGARGADEETNRFNANEQNQTALANLDARLRKMGLDDQTRLAILQGMGGSAGPGQNVPAGILAAGAGMYAQHATQSAQGGGNQPPSLSAQYPHNTDDPYGGTGPATTPA